MKKKKLPLALLALAFAGAAGAAAYADTAEGSWNGADVTVGVAPGGDIAAVLQETSAQAQATVPQNTQQGMLSSAAGPAKGETDVDFDVRKFELPEGAGVLVVVEGTGGADCMVYAYEDSGNGWERRLQTYGYLGENGMSNHRTAGDKTTPIGLFQMNTPFGQKDALDGFPSNYLKTKISHVWRSSTNKLVDDVGAYGDGEQIGTSWYSGYYDYAIDAGFNINGIPNQGSALFLHCIGQNKTYTSGCVAIPTEQMIAVMRLYGAHGDGACYIAQAPKGTFALIYQSYGVNNGLSPDGDFTNQ